MSAGCETRRNSAKYLDAEVASDLLEMGGGGRRIPLGPSVEFRKPDSRLRLAQQLETVGVEIVAEDFEPFVQSLVRELVAPPLKLCVEVLRLEEEPTLLWAQNREVLITAGAYMDATHRLARKTPGGGALIERINQIAPAANLVLGIFNAFLNTRR